MECYICLDICDTKKYTIRRCGHCFHKKCIYEWFEKICHVQYVEPMCM